MPAARQALFSCSIAACLVGHVCGETARAKQWDDERIAGPFVCRADFSLEPHLALFSQMAEVQKELVHALGVPAAKEPVEVYLFKEKSTYQRYLATYFPQVPYRRALFVKTGGAGRVYVHHGQDFETDLRHESTHGLLHASLPMVPLWLDEGLAEYFEAPPEQRAAKHPNRRKLSMRPFFPTAPHLKVLESRRDIAEMGETDYVHAWAWVHFMLHGPPEAHQELVQFLADIRAGSPPGLLSDRLQRRLPDVERRWVQHFKNTNW